MTVGLAFCTFSEKRLETGVQTLQAALTARAGSRMRVEERRRVSVLFFAIMTILREPKGTEGLFSPGTGPFGNIIVMRELGSWEMGKERLDPK